MKGKSDLCLLYDELCFDRMKINVRSFIAWRKKKEEENDPTPTPNPSERYQMVFFVLLKGVASKPSVCFQPLCAAQNSFNWLEEVRGT